MQTMAAAGLAGAAAADAPLPKRPLGKTGLSVSVLGLGGARIGMLDDGGRLRMWSNAAMTWGQLLRLRFAGAYGLSQSRYGAALKGLRDKVIFGRRRGTAR
jgi:aryl-alcohol dehydrogenase-like predicted oxidoreductase